MDNYILQPTSAVKPQLRFIGEVLDDGDVRILPCVTSEAEVEKILAALKRLGQKTR